MFWICLCIREIITFELSVISVSFTLYCVEDVFVSGFFGIDETTLEKVNSGFLLIVNLSGLRIC